MLNNRSFNDETKTHGLFTKSFLRKLSLTVHADEGEGDTTPPLKQPETNIEDLLKKVRQEEKDKLYPRIEKAENEAKESVKSLNKYIMKCSALEDELTKVKGDKTNSEKETELQVKLDAATTELEKLKKQLAEAPTEETITQKVKAEFELKSYTKDTITESKGDILSVLSSELLTKTFATKEEVDAAVASAKERTLEVKKELGLDKEEKPATPPSTPTTPKTPPVANPTSGVTEKDLDPETIRNMSPKDYAEFRKKLGLK